MTSTNFYPLMSISHIKKYKLDYSWFVYHLCESKIYFIACDKYILILIDLFDTQVTNINPYTLYKLIWVVDSGKLPATLTLFQSLYENLRVQRNVQELVKFSNATKHQQCSHRYDITGLVCSTKSSYGNQEVIWW